METAAHPARHPVDEPPPARRVLWRAIGAIVGALLVYAAWRGYQRPELLLDLANFRLC